MRQPIEVKLLLAGKRIDPNAKAVVQDLTPLDVAAEQGHTEVARQLLAGKRIDPNAEVPVNNGGHPNAEDKEVQERRERRMSVEMKKKEILLDMQAKSKDKI